MVPQALLPIAVVVAYDYDPYTGGDGGSGGADYDYSNDPGYTPYDGSAGGGEAIEVVGPSNGPGVLADPSEYAVEYGAVLASGVAAFASVLGAIVTASVMLSVFRAGLRAVRGAFL